MYFKKVESKLLKVGLVWMKVDSKQENHIIGKTSSDLVTF